MSYTVKQLLSLDEMALSSYKVGDLGHVIKWAGGKGVAKGTYFSKLHSTHKDFNPTDMKHLTD